MKLTSYVKDVIVKSSKPFPVEMIIENDDDKEFKIVPIIEMEIEGKTRMITVAEIFSIKPSKKRKISLEPKAPDVEGTGKISFIIESDGKEIIRHEKPIAIIKEYREKPLYVAFVWHHHQAPNYLPDKSFHSLWAFKHVYDGEFYGFRKGGPYDVHMQLHVKHSGICDNDHFSPSLLEQWLILLNNDVRFQKTIGYENIEKIKKVLEYLRKYIHEGKIELLGGMYAHTIQGFLLKEFIRRGYGEFIKELLLWEWKIGLDISEKIMGIKPRGVWTPEMFWSMELLSIYSEIGINYTVLCEQHFKLAGGNKNTIYEPYILEDLITGNRLTVFFRDLELSNWISFNVAFKDKEEAEISAREFVLKLFERYLKYPGKICVIALDGENWMIIPELKKYSAYFLDRVWSYIEEAKKLFVTITLSEYLIKKPAERVLYYIPYGSWIFLSEDQWIGGIKDELWKNVFSKLLLIESYFMIIPKGEREKMMYDERSPLYKVMKALSISLDSDYYWYGEEEVYRKAINAWLDEAYNIAHKQLSRIETKITKERDYTIVIEICNKLEHNIKLNIVLKHENNIVRNVEITVASGEMEKVYMPFSKERKCSLEIYASKLLLDSYNMK